jgi:hypothetical protein
MDAQLSGTLRQMEEFLIETRAFKHTRRPVAPENNKMLQRGDYIL